MRDARRQLAEYFSGQRKEFDLPIDWSGFGPAQRQVLGLLDDDVGYGETVTYGTLAGRAGIPASTDVIPARAVGQIMGSNPIPVIVPCHRVVASDGLGGYSGGACPASQALAADPGRLTAAHPGLGPRLPARRLSHPGMAARADQPSPGRPRPASLT